jgi:uracil phosphoribosyltransferase
MEGIDKVIKQRLHINTHPLVRNKITMLRDKNTGHKQFRELVGEIAAFICYEATQNMPVIEKTVETPVSTAKGWCCEHKFGLIPILRAGLGMVDGISNLLPTAKVGHIGMYRDPSTLQPVEYYAKLPSEIEEREILLLDPMLATGRTAEASISYLKKQGAKNIKFLCLVAVREGVEEVLKNHPDIDIYTAAYDEMLNDHGYIVPGLGDAGDRLFGTR